jgi:ABC-type dipeptide/oligopeptide/nickel transport system permease subunit
MARVGEPIDAGFGTAPEASTESRPESALARLPWVSFFIIVVLALVALLAPLIAPHSPTEQSLPDKLSPPAWQEGGSTKYLLGTDVLGRDVLSRLIYGARVSLIVPRRRCWPAAASGSWWGSCPAISAAASTAS